MTSYEAYDAGLPCKNKSCSSHGKPHPNCRCYGNMAAGGEVSPYCDKEQPHRRACKYFADGGPVHDLDVPQHQDPEDSVAAYLTQGGLHGLLKPDPSSPQQALDSYNSGVNRGDKFLKAKIDSLFTGKKMPPMDHEKAKVKIDDWISRGGITNDIKNEMANQHAPSMFAGGGSVEKQDGLMHNHAVAEAYPEQSALLQEAKGRMSGYLNGLKPQKGSTPKLAFDSEPDDRLQKKSYDSVLHMAAHPAKILDDIQKGTITPEHMQHFIALHPGLNDALQKRLTQKITEYQVEGKKPPRNVRQGLSLFMGTALSGELSPQNMQAVQSVFQAKKAQQQGGGEPPKKTSALAKSSQSYLLPNQAAAERQQKQ